MRKEVWIVIYQVMAREVNKAFFVEIDCDDFMCTNNVFGNCSNKDCISWRGDGS